MKRPNLIIGMKDKKASHGCLGSIFNKPGKISPNWGKEMSIHLQRVFRTPNRQVQKRNCIVKSSTCTEQVKCIELYKKEILKIKTDPLQYCGFSTEISNAITLGTALKF